MNFGVFLFSRYTSSGLLGECPIFVPTTRTSAAPNVNCDAFKKTLISALLKEKYGLYQDACLDSLYAEDKPFCLV